MKTQMSVGKQNLAAGVQGMALQNVRCLRRVSLFMLHGAQDNVCTVDSR